MMPKLATFIVVLLGMALFGCATEERPKEITSERSTDRPNIVFVITDDQGYGDLGVHGNPFVQTPNIDQLAKESVSLTDYHVAPTCSPTRAALLTGRWTNRTGVWHTIMGRSMLREDEVTIADMLQANGYHTAMIGKWHLGDNYPYRPMDRGFEHAYYHGGGGVGQTPDYWNNAYFDGSYFRNGEPEPAKGFVTDVLFKEAIQYIDSVKDSGKPFFTYISANAPHGPMHAPKEYADLYANKGLPEKPESTTHFYGMITNIDDNIAKLRSYLKKNNLDQNTIFIYTTDNGSSAGAAVYNSGMRGNKGSEYDGGHRVPFFMHWPEAGLNEGKIVDTITSYVDIVPTLLDYTNTAAPEGIKFDGVNIHALVEGDSADWPDRILVTDSQRVLDPIKWRKSAVMTDQWRLVNGEELYDITRDPGQENDIAGQHPEVVKRLREFYEQWWQELEPTFGEPTPIYLGSEQANPVYLNSHDWLGHNKIVPWKQSYIRQGVREDDGEHKGYWWVNVVEAGEYEFELRRWPEEANTPISSGMPAGQPVAGDRSYRDFKGEAFDAELAYMTIGGKRLEAKVDDSATHITFKTSLEKGKGKLAAAFVNKAREELGAYYVTVRKL
ncbi:arylsulfatase [Gilvimarinus agarilyticus]|nr:arylsulfatase [Gilvimarinus agarilyticus]